MVTGAWVLAFIVGIGVIVWGAEAFAAHLSAASTRMRVSAFALAVLLAGAEPEELATVVTAGVRGSPGIAFGDVIGANIAMCLVALGVGACIAPLPFGSKVMRYALLGLPLGAIAAWVAWDGVVGRSEGGLLVALYVLYIAVIWATERRPPSLGEVQELEEAREYSAAGREQSWLGRDLAMVVAGVAAMAAGASLLVEAVQRIATVEIAQTRLGLTLVGFATAFELVVLAWSAARRGASETVVAGVVRSFAYNVTMTLGVGALAHPLVVSDAIALHVPWVIMIGALVLVTLLAARFGRIDRQSGVLLLAVYPVFVASVLLG